MKLNRFLTSAFLIFGLSITSFAIESKTGVVISKPGLSYSTTLPVDVSDYERFSVQAVYSSATAAAHNVSEGSKSNNTITVSDFAELAAKRASVTITVSSNGATALDGAVVTLNGVSFTEGVDWQIDSSSITTAKNISDAITAHPSFISTHTLTDTAVVTASAAEVGRFANGWTATVSTTALTLSASVFSAGRDNAYITIADGTNAITLTQGTDWTAATSDNATAVSLKDAINANSTLSAIIVASTGGTSSGIVYATSTTNGINAYFISTSTSSLAVGTPHFENGAASDVSISNDTISEPSHGLSTGFRVLLTTTAPNLPPTGLTNGVTYYAIRSNDNVYKLATTSLNSIGGTAIDLTAQTNSSTFTVTPITFSAGSTGFHWQASNDGSNWANLSVTSVTYSANGTNLWDFAEYAYRYLRLNFVAPTWGGIDLTVTQTGKK